MTNTKKIKFTTLVLSVCMLATLWLMDSKYGDGILFRGTEPFRFGITPSYTFQSIVEKLLILTAFSCGVLLLSLLAKKKDGVFGSDRRLLQLVAILDLFLVIILVYAGVRSAGGIYTVNDAGKAEYLTSYWMAVAPCGIAAAVQVLLNVWGLRSVEK